MEEIFPTLLTFPIFCFKLSWFCFGEMTLKIVKAMPAVAIDAEFLNFMDSSPSIHQKPFL